MEIFRPFLGHASTGNIRVLLVQPGVFRGRLILTCRGQRSMLILALLVAFGCCTMCLFAVILHTIGTRIGCRKREIYIYLVGEAGQRFLCPFRTSIATSAPSLKSGLHRDCFANKHRTCWFAIPRHGKGRGRRRSWNEISESRFLSTWRI